MSKRFTMIYLKPKRLFKKSTDHWNFSRSQTQILSACKQMYSIGRRKVNSVCTWSLRNILIIIGYPQSFCKYRSGILNIGQL